MRHIGATIHLAVVVLLASAPPTATASEVVVSAGAGVFDPWDGSAGHEIDASVLATLGARKHFRLGGEFAYRKAETQILQVKNVDFDSYRISFVAHYRPVVGWFAEPYLGTKLTTAWNDSDGKHIELARPGKDVHHSETLGIGAAGIVGLDVPIGDRFAFYAEASVSADLLQVDAHNDDSRGNDDEWFDFDLDLGPKIQTSSENAGGVTGTAGIRFRF